MPAQPPPWWSAFIDDPDGERPLDAATPAGEPGELESVPPQPASVPLPDEA